MHFVPIKVSGERAESEPVLWRVKRPTELGVKCKETVFGPSGSTVLLDNTGGIR